MWLERELHNNNRAGWMKVVVCRLAARPPYRGRSGVGNTHEVPRIDDGGQIVCAGELEYRDVNAMIKLPRFKLACPRASTSAAPPANISSMRFAAGLRPARTGDQAGTVNRQSVQPKGPHNRRNVPATALWGI